MTTTTPEATYDVICEALACPKCGHVSTNPIAQELQTKLAKHKAVRCLRIGDRVEVVDSPVDDWGYYALKDRAAWQSGRAETNFLETWSCESCGTSFLWALVTVGDGILKAVRAVELTDEVMDSADYLSNQAAFLFSSEEIPRLRTLSATELKKAVLAAEQP